MYFLALNEASLKYSQYNIVIYCPHGHACHMLFIFLLNDTCTSQLRSSQKGNIQHAVAYQPMGKFVRIEVQAHQGARVAISWAK